MPTLQDVRAALGADWIEPLGFNESRLPQGITMDDIVQLENRLAMPWETEHRKDRGVTYGQWLVLLRWTLPYDNHVRGAVATQSAIVLPWLATKLGKGDRTSDIITTNHLLHFFSSMGMAGAACSAGVSLFTKSITSWAVEATGNDYNRELSWRNLEELFLRFEDEGHYNRGAQAWIKAVIRWCRFVPLLGSPSAEDLVWIFGMVEDAALMREVKERRGISDAQMPELIETIKMLEGSLWRVTDTNGEGTIVMPVVVPKFDIVRAEGGIGALNELKQWRWVSAGHCGWARRDSDKYGTSANIALPRKLMPQSRLASAVRENAPMLVPKVGTIYSHSEAALMFRCAYLEHTELSADLDRFIYDTAQTALDQLEVPVFDGDDIPAEVETTDPDDGAGDNTANEEVEA